MEQSREKLKVIDIEFKRNNTNKQTLFFDVIEHRFEDQFLVIKHYKEYDDNRDSVYIPLSNIALIEYFKSMKEFNQMYPPGHKYY